jgi:hypothetical protein
VGEDLEQQAGITDRSKSLDGSKTGALQSKAMSRRMLCMGMLFLLFLPHVFAQTQNKTVVITVLRAEPGQTAQVAFGRAISDTVELILRLSGGFTVTRADFLLPEVSLSDSRLYYGQVKAEKAVYGTVRRSGDTGSEIDVSIWSASEPTSSRQVTRTIRTALEVFDVADDLAVQVASAVAGRDLALGTIELRNTDALDQFSVYVDKLLVGKNVTRFRVPAGPHQLIVAKAGLLGDQAVQAFDATVHADETLELSLEIKKEQAEKPAQPAAQPAQAEASQQGLLVQTGTLKVSTEPSGARVLLDRKLLGVTPLELFGVPVGRYELRLERELFRGITQLADIRANEATETAQTLEVDQAYPKVKAALITPWVSSMISAGTLLLQSGYIGGVAAVDTSYFNGAFNAVVPALDIGISESMRGFGHFSTGDYNTGLILTLVTAGTWVASLGLNYWYNALNQQALAAQSTGSYQPTPLISFLSGAYIGLPIASMSLAVLYDIAFVPLSATRMNEKILETIRRTGSLPVPPTYLERRWEIEAGAGAMARVGYRLPLIKDWLYAEALGAVSLTSLYPMEIGPALTARLSGYPFGSMTGAVRPFITLGLTADTDFSSFGLAIDAALGYDLRLPWLDMYSLSQLTWGLIAGTRSVLFGIGVRL